MKESYGEGLATHTDPESCGAAREGGVEALTGERTARVFSREGRCLRGADAVRGGEEGKGVGGGNRGEENAPRRPRREGALSAVERVRQAARRDKAMRFTALLHHVYDLEALRTAYLNLKREAAPGVDGETWRLNGGGPGGPFPSFAVVPPRPAVHAGGGLPLGAELRRPGRFAGLYVGQGGCETQSLCP